MKVQLALLAALVCCTVGSSIGPYGLVKLGPYGSWNTPINGLSTPTIFRVTDEANYLKLSCWRKRPSSDSKPYIDDRLCGGDGCICIGRPDREIKIGGQWCQVFKKTFKLCRVPPYIFCKVRASVDYEPCP